MKDKQVKEALPKPGYKVVEKVYEIDHYEDINDVIQAVDNDNGMRNRDYESASEGLLKIGQRLKLNQKISHHLVICCFLLSLIQSVIYFIRTLKANCDDDITQPITFDGSFIHFFIFLIITFFSMVGLIGITDIKIKFICSFLAALLIFNFAVIISLSELLLFQGLA